MLPKTKLSIAIEAILDTRLTIAVASVVLVVARLRLPIVLPLLPSLLVFLSLLVLLIDMVDESIDDSNGITLSIDTPSSLVIVLILLKRLVLDFDISSGLFAKL